MSRVRFHHVAIAIAVLTGLTVLALAVGVLAPGLPVPEQKVIEMEGSPTEDEVAAEIDRLRQDGWSLDAVEQTDDATRLHVFRTCR